MLSCVPRDVRVQYARSGCGYVSLVLSCVQRDVRVQYAFAGCGYPLCSLAYHGMCVFNTRVLRVPVRKARCITVSIVTHLWTSLSLYNVVCLVLVERLVDAERLFGEGFARFLD